MRKHSIMRYRETEDLTFRNCGARGRALSNFESSPAQHEETIFRAAAIAWLPRRRPHFCYTYIAPAVRHLGALGLSCSDHLQLAFMASSNGANARSKATEIIKEQIKSSAENQPVKELKGETSGQFPGFAG